MKTSDGREIICYEIARSDLYVPAGSNLDFRSDGDGDGDGDGNSGDLVLFASNVGPDLWVQVEDGEWIIWTAGQDISDELAELQTAGIREHTEAGCCQQQPQAG